MHQSQPKRRALLLVMARHPELVSLLFAVVFALFANRISPSQSTEFPSSQPQAIFSPYSPVTDYIYGSMQSVRQHIQNSSTEVYFIMYYAHWDGESLETATEFEQAAYRLHGQVTFLAVNCWWPSGSCRKSVPLKYFPMLMAYNSNFEGIQYHGIVKTAYIVDFLKRICSPVSYVPDDIELGKFVAQTESTVLGHFDFSRSLQPSGYSTYYQAALLSLEKDPIQPMPFGVITSSQLANSYGILMPKTVYMTRVMNTSVVYPPSANFTASSIVQWAHQYREELVPWIVPSPIKSLKLSSQVKDEPFVLLLTSDEASDHFKGNYQQLREVAMDYYNCNGSSKIQTTLELLTAIRIQEEQIEKLKLAIKRRASSVAASKRLPCCNSFVEEISGINQHTNNICDICIENRTKLQMQPCVFFTDMLDGALPFTDQYIFFSRGCVNLNNYYDPQVHFSVCCNLSDSSRRNLKEVSCLSDDEPSCGSHGDADSRGTFHFPSSDVSPPKYNASYTAAIEQMKSAMEFTGLGCHTNRSVNFFALNWDEYGLIAKRLGIVPKKKKVPTATLR